MKSSERYIKRIAIPIALAALIAVTANMVFRAVTSEPEVAENKTSGYPAGSVEVEGQDQENAEFNEQQLQSEIAALELTLSELEETTPENVAPEIKDLKSQAEDKVKSLEQANPNNWLALRDDAYETIQDYATAVGSKKEIRP